MGDFSCDAVIMFPPIQLSSSTFTQSWLHAINTVDVLENESGYETAVFYVICSIGRRNVFQHMFLCNGHPKFTKRA